VVNTENVTLGDAMVSCAVSQGRLVSLKNCDQIQYLQNQIFNENLKSNEIYFVGVFLFGKDTKFPSRYVPPTTIYAIDS
jgi:hypothetical protein